MVDRQAYLPVFLPNEPHEWKEVAGIATINEEGEIHIRLQNKAAAMELVDQQTKGMIVALGFDYRTSASVPRHIKDKEQANPDDEITPGKV